IAAAWPRACARTSCCGTRRRRPNFATGWAATWRPRPGAAAASCTEARETLPRNAERGARRRVPGVLLRGGDQPALATVFLATAFFTTVFLAAGAAAPAAARVPPWRRALP